MVVQRNPRRPFIWLVVILTVATALVVGLSACSRASAPSTTRATPSPQVANAPATAPKPVTSASSPPASASTAPNSVQVAQPTATSLPTVPAATDLAVQTLAGKDLPSAGWTTGGVSVSFRASAIAGEALVPQVEVVKAGQPFTGQPTTQGTPTVSPGGQISARITLKDLTPGQYAWQARFFSNETRQDGVWTADSNGDAAFGIVGPPPTIQNASIQGTTQVTGGVPVVGPTDQASVDWSVSAQPNEALDHLAYLADHQSNAPTTVPTNTTTLPATAASLPLPDLQDGQWFIHLWAVDKAGQVGAPASVAVTVMRQPLKLGDVFYRTWATNPAYQTVPIQFTISRAATVTLTIFPESSTTVERRYDLGLQQPNQPIKASWDGKDAKGAIAAVGNYRFLIDAVDPSGTDTQGIYTGLTITDKVIKVSLGTQRLTAYEGNKLFVTTLVTTGGADIPTPTGQFEILEKSSPFVFHSPYPKGNKYWYPDVTSNRAMLFDQKDADFVHDAPWRSKFGPGTNGPGIPGQPYTGSHGCVETPTNAMAQLYPWTPLGTPVVITK